MAAAVGRLKGVCVTVSGVFVVIRRLVLEATVGAVVKAPSRVASRVAGS